MSSWLLHDTWDTIWLPRDAYDPDGDTITLSIVQGPSNGTLSFDPTTGYATYTANAHFVGNDSFTFWATDGIATSNVATVSITVTNQAPVVTDDGMSLLHDTSDSIWLPGDAYEPDGDSTTLSIVQGPSNGTLSFDPTTGYATYTPNTHFVGNDSFTFWASDGIDTSNVATVTIAVTDQAPVALDDSMSVLHDTTGTLWLGGDAYDPDGDNVALNVVQAPSNGVVTIDPVSYVASYTPNAHFIGTDSFTFSASDGILSSNTATVSITVTDQAPVAADDSYGDIHDTTLTVPAAAGVLANDSDPDADTLVVSAVNGDAASVGQTITLSSGAQLTLNADGAFSYKPSTHFVGSDSFTYLAGDGVLTSGTATVTIEVTNQTPTPQDDSYSVAQGQLLTVGAAPGVLANDSDPDGDTLVVSAVNGSAASVGQTITLASGAQLTLNADGSFTYQALADYVGQDSFSYSASDGIAAAKANVTINVTGQDFVWTGAGSDSLASDALNWLGDTVPGYGDFIIFNSTSSKPADFDGGFTSLVAGMEVDAAYNSTITLDQAFSVDGNYSQTGSTITGGGMLTLLAMAIIQGTPTMSAAGGTTVAQGSTLTLSGGGNLNVGQGGLTVNGGGTFVATAGQVVVSNGGVITNNGTFNLQGDNLGISQGAGALGSFVNGGTFLKSQSLLADVAQVGIPFSSSGQMNVQTGVLNFTTSLTQTAGTLTINAGAEVQGQGMTMAGGQIQGGGTLHATGGGLYFQGAGLTGSGTVLVDAGVKMAVQAALSDLGFTTTNNGDVFWTAGDITLGNGAVINNQGSGVFHIQCDQRIANGGGGATFNNYGTFQKETGPGSTVVQVTFNSLLQGGNSSVITAQAGIIAFSVAGTFQANISSGAGAEVDFSGILQSFTLMSGAQFSAGTVRVTNGATLSLAAGLKLTSAGILQLGGGVPVIPVFGMPAVLMVGNVSGNGVLNNTGTIVWHGGRISVLVQNQSQLTVASDVVQFPPTLSSTLANNGTITWVGGNILLDPGSQISNLGLFDVQTDSAITGESAKGIVNDKLGVFQKSLGAGGQTTIDTPFTSSGTVNLMGNNASFLTGLRITSGDLNVAGGSLSTTSLLWNGGNVNLGTTGTGMLTLTGGLPLTVPQGWVLWGIGTINGDVTNAGTINLGYNGAAMIGQLTITGDFTQQDTGTLVLRVQGNQQYDSLGIGGTATLAGTLRVTLVGGFSPAANDSFMLMAYEGVVGNFGQYVLPWLPAPRSWAPAAPGAGSLTVAVR